MRSIVYGLAIAVLSQPLPFFSLTVASTPQLAQAPKPINALVSVSLPVRATVWLRAGGSTIGQVMGFDAKQQVLTLGGSTIQLAKVDKVSFDRGSLTYDAIRGIWIRGEDIAKPKQSVWQNLALSAFQVEDPKLGKAKVNLERVMKPIEVRGIQSVAVKSVYVVDEIQFQSAGKMTIKVTPRDR